MENYIRNFNSINQFYNYLMTTPHNEYERMDNSQHSGFSEKQFKGTFNWQEAEDLLIHGWKEGSEKLTIKMKTKKMNSNMEAYNKVFKDVTGYQVNIADYLMGIPNCMYNSKRVVKKQRVVTLVKPISYSCRITKEEIEEESIKAFQIIQSLENSGIRVNLLVSFMGEADDRRVGCTVKIKNANERFSIAKMAFPLIHPSMLRRFMFKYEEVCPDTTKGFVWSYGRPVSANDMRAMKEFKGMYILPDFFSGKPEDINSLDELQKYTR